MTLISRLAALAMIGPLALGGCSLPGRPAGELVVVVDAPVSRAPWIADIGRQGAELATARINSSGGVNIAGSSYNLRIEVMDNGGSATAAADNIRRAVQQKAVAILDDGSTAASTYSAAAGASLPLLVYHDGSAGLVDPDKRPLLFRVAPPNDALAERLVPYAAGKSPKIATVHDDSDYGRDGDAQVQQALGTAKVKPLASVELPSTATDYSAQAAQVARSGATGVVVWARAPVLAAFVKALRQSGSQIAVYSGPTAEDPVVRTQLASQPAWVEGLTYASFRITSEEGPDAWEKFRKAYEDRFHDYKVGVQDHSRKDVIQPPDWQMFSYDMVYLLKAALEKSGTTAPGPKLVDALNSVEVLAANGDHRGWKKDNHEGVVDDDIYFATFQDMKFKPVQDDALSKSLPPIDQL